MNTNKPSVKPPTFVVIGHTRFNLEHVTHYSAANISHEAYRLDYKNSYGVRIDFIGGKPLTLECETLEECNFIIAKLDNMCMPYRISLPEGEEKEGSNE